MSTSIYSFNALLNTKKHFSQMRWGVLEINKVSQIKFNDKMIVFWLHFDFIFLFFFLNY